MLNSSLRVQLSVVNNNREFIGFNVRRFYKLYKRQQKFSFFLSARAGCILQILPGVGRIFLSLTTVTVTARKPLNEN